MYGCATRPTTSEGYERTFGVRFTRNG
jgi:hypothetical protein